MKKNIILNSLTGNTVLAVTTCLVQPGTAHIVPFLHTQDVLSYIGDYSCTLVPMIIFLKVEEGVTKREKEGRKGGR